MNLYFDAGQWSAREAYEDAFWASVEEQCLVLSTKRSCSCPPHGKKLILQDVFNNSFLFQPDRAVFLQLDTVDRSIFPSSPNCKNNLEFVIAWRLLRGGPCVAIVCPRKSMPYIIIESIDPALSLSG